MPTPPLASGPDHLRPLLDPATAHTALAGLDPPAPLAGPTSEIAVTLRALGGIGALVDQACDLAQDFAGTVDAHPAFELYAPPTLGTVLFRPRHTTDERVVQFRRDLLTDGHAVLVPARLDGRRRLKVTLLNPHSRPADLAGLLKLVEGHTSR